MPEGHNDFAQLTASDAVAAYEALTMMMDVANGFLGQPRLHIDAPMGINFTSVGDYLEDFCSWLALERDGVVDGLRHKRFKDRHAEEDRVFLLLRHEAACGPDLGEWLSLAAALIAKVPRS